MLKRFTSSDGHAETITVAILACHEACRLIIHLMSLAPQKRTRKSVSA